MLIFIKEKEFKSPDLSRFFIPSNIYVCKKKVKFFSAQEAYKVRDRKYPDLNVYFCSVCEGWHLGHRLGWKKLKQERTFLTEEDFPLFSNTSFHKIFKLVNINKKRTRDFLRKIDAEEF